MEHIRKKPEILNQSVINYYYYVEQDELYSTSHIYLRKLLKTLHHYGFNDQDFWERLDTLWGSYIRYHCPKF